MGFPHDDPTTVNFVVIRLCDNDYGTGMTHALQHLRDDWVTKGGIGLDAAQCKTFIIMSIIGYHGVHPSDYGKPIDWGRLQRIAEYLAGMRVTFDQHAPKEDHDGGSAALCLHSGEIWRF